MTLRLPTSAPQQLIGLRSLSSTPALSPVDMGLPAQFTEWRPGQWPAVEKICDSQRRFIVICAPTGFGKTLAYAAAAVLSHGRTAVLTATKGLQDQVSSDFAELAVDIRGQNNYPCPRAEELGVPVSTAVSEAPCSCGFYCERRRKGGCEYFDRYRQARYANLVVTNYQCWMYDRLKEGESLHIHPETYKQMLERDGVLKPDGRTPINMLILDEAHDADSQLSKFVGIDLSRREVLALHMEWPNSGMTVNEWAEWAGEVQQDIHSRVEILEAHIKNQGGKGWSKELKHLREMDRKLEKLVDMRAEDDWIVDEQEPEGRSMKSVRFDPLSPARYAESVLWRGAEKVVLVSATVRPKTAELLGIPSEELEFVEYGSSFEPKRRPVIAVKSVQMNYRTEQDDDAMVWWLRKLDALIEDRQDRKGIVHAVCIAPKTRVLTEDLRWVPAADVRTGHALLGFEEFPSKGLGGHRKWERSIVQEAMTVDLPSVRLTLEDGTVLVCSKDHLWLTHNSVHPRWMRSENMLPLCPGGQSSWLMKATDVWDEVRDWKTGYLSAAYDGEGCLIMRSQPKVGRTGNPTQSRSINVNFTQKPNCMMQRVRELLAGYGFVDRLYTTTHKSADTLRVSYKPDVLRLLGQLRPQRLLQKFDPNALGKFTLHRRVRVLKKEDIGIQKLVFLQTTSSTFIAEGFASHNSYKRARFIVDNSRHRRIMLIHHSHNRDMVVRQFRDAEAPAVLVSPSVDTGYDFPNNSARYQIIAKIPFASVQDKIIKARQDRDKEYGLYLAAQTLVQMTGRIMRSMDDWGESLLLDDNALWFIPKVRKFLPQWWLEAYESRGGMPRPLMVCEWCNGVHEGGPEGCVE